MHSLKDKRILDVINHELNTPLTVIRGYMELLEQTSEGEEKLYIDTIMKNVERLEKAPNNIMEKLSEPSP